MPAGHQAVRHNCQQIAYMHDSMKAVFQMNLKKKAILKRIKHLEESIAKGHEYLESGEHAHWHGFRPLFFPKVKDGKMLPPHKN